MPASLSFVSSSATALHFFTHSALFCSLDENNASLVIFRASFLEEVEGRRRAASLSASVALPTAMRKKQSTKHQRRTFRERHNERPISISISNSKTKIYSAMSCENIVNMIWKTLWSFTNERTNKRYQWRFNWCPELIVMACFDT